MVFLPSSFPTKNLYTPLPSAMRATRPTHLILLDFITRTILGEVYRLLSCSMCSFLHFPVTSFLLSPIILHSTPFSSSLSLRSSLNVSDQVSNPHKNNRQNYSSVYLNLYIFGQQTGRQKILHRMIASIPRLQSSLTFFLKIILIC